MTIGSDTHMTCPQFGLASANPHSLGGPTTQNVPEIEVEAMIRGLPHPFEGKGASGKKFKTDQSEATEADPLLSSNPGGRTTQTGFAGTFRARRSSRSPNTANFPMDSSTPSRQQRHGDRFGTYRSSDEYSAYNEEMAGTAGLSFGPGSATAYTNQQELPSHSQQQTSDAPTPDHQERRAGMYRPNPVQETQQQRGGDHPPLLEIPEEIYAVRKAALQVLKPLTSSWVSPLNQFGFI